MDLLINLDSPIVAGKRLQTNYTTKSPLIPCPNISGRNGLQNNPFDDVVKTVELNQQPSDPFDIVLQASVKKADHEIEINKNGKSFSEMSNNEILQEKVASEKEVTDLTMIKTNIKEFVSERTNGCIERTINSSLAQIDFTNKTKSSQKYLRRSFSVGDARTRSLVTSYRSNYLNNSFTSGVSRVSKDTSNKVSANCSCGSENLQDSNTSLSDNNHFNRFEMIKNKFREESRRIAKMINKESSNTSGLRKQVRKSFDKNENIFEESEIINTDSSDDLIDIKPPWEIHEILLSDEEDSVGLPKLKTFKHCFSGITNQLAIGDGIINKYMKKKRSVDLGQPNEISKEEETPQITECFTPDQVAASSSLLEDIDQAFRETKPPTEMKEDVQKGPQLVSGIIKQSLRPKKLVGKETVRKGPMKAIVPLQKMSKNVTSKLSSPFKKKVQSTSNNCKDDHVTETQIKPVAASTPTKSLSPSTKESPIRNTSFTRNQDIKTTPTGRKSANRSTSSVESLGNRSLDNLQINSAKKATQADIKVVPTRPRSAPHSGNNEKVSVKNRTALKVLSKPINRAVRAMDVKQITSKFKPKDKASIQGKENQVNLRE